MYVVYWQYNNIVSIVCKKNTNIWKWKQKIVYDGGGFCYYMEGDKARVYSKII